MSDSTNATKNDKVQKLQCRFCGVKVNRWKKLRNGKMIDGFDTMKEHVLDHHGEEAEKMGFTNEYE